jgi:hypothetical protein
METTKKLEKLIKDMLTKNDSLQSPTSLEGQRSSLLIKEDVGGNLC